MTVGLLMIDELVSIWKDMVMPNEGTFLAYA
jgi:hypothetical protein